MRTTNPAKCSRLEAPILEVLSRVNVAEDSDYVDFNGLDVNTDLFYILFLRIKNPATDASDYYIFFNQDYVAANYRWQQLEAYGNAVVAGWGDASWIAYSQKGYGFLERLLVARDPAGYARWTTEVSRRCNDGNPLVAGAAVGYKLATVTNITSIRIAASQPGGIGADSTLLLCRTRSE